ncbi:MAG: putative metallo-hydrolase YycJ [Dehalococcoidia bacterium]|nr:putative metallo-hydrolase YycJ [Bacillota bacterium]
MLELWMLASGSSGNAVYITTENARLLIDAGLSGKFPFNFILLSQLFVIVILTPKNQAASPWF